MEKIKAILNGVEVELANSNISWDFVSSDGSPSAILLNDLILELYRGGYDDPTDGLNVVNNWLNSQGLLTNMPVQILHEDFGVLLDGYSDFTSRDTRLSCDTANLHVKSTHETFLELATKFNLRGELNRNDSDIRRDVIYVEEGIPDYIGAAISAIALYTSTIALIQAINGVTEAASNVPPTGLPVAIINLSLTTAQVALLLNSVIDLLYPIKRKYNCANTYNLLKKSVEKLGYQFETNIYNGKFSKKALLWSTFEEGVNPAANATNNALPDLTLAELFEEEGLFFNARVKVSDGVVYFKHVWEYYTAPSTFEIPSMQDGVEVTYNINELPKSYSFRFAQDESDKNTLSNSFRNVITVTYEGSGGQTFSFSEAIVEQSRFARANKKETQSLIESYFLTLGAVLNTLTFGVFSIPAGSTIGCMKLEGSFVSVPKILLVNEDGTLDAMYKDYVNAEYIYDNYKAPTFINGAWGRWSIIENVAPFGICGDSGNTDVVLSQLRENNVCTDSMGNVAVIESHVYNSDTNLHEFRYRVQGWKNPISDQWSDINIGVVNEIKTFD